MGFLAQSPRPSSPLLPCSSLPFYSIPLFPSPPLPSPPPNIKSPRTYLLSSPIDFFFQRSNLRFGFAKWRRGKIWSGMWAVKSFFSLRRLVLRALLFLWQFLRRCYRVVQCGREEEEEDDEAAAMAQDSWDADKMWVSFLSLLLPRVYFSEQIAFGRETCCHFSFFNLHTFFLFWCAREGFLKFLRFCVPPPPLISFRRLVSSPSVLNHCFLCFFLLTSAPLSPLVLSDYPLKNKWPTLFVQEQMLY